MVNIFDESGVLKRYSRTSQSKAVDILYRFLILGENLPDIDKATKTARWRTLMILSGYAVRGLDDCGKAQGSKEDIEAFVKEFPEGTYKKKLTFMDWMKQKEELSMDALFDMLGNKSSHYLEYAEKLGISTDGISSIDTEPFGDYGHLVKLTYGSGYQGIFYHDDHFTIKMDVFPFKERWGDMLYHINYTAGWTGYFDTSRNHLKLENEYFATFLVALSLYDNNRLIRYNDSEMAGCENINDDDLITCLNLLRPEDLFAIFDKLSIGHLYVLYGCSTYNSDELRIKIHQFSLCMGFLTRAMVHGGYSRETALAWLHRCLDFSLPDVSNKYHYFELFYLLFSFKTYPNLEIQSCNKKWIDYFIDAVSNLSPDRIPFTRLAANIFCSFYRLPRVLIDELHSIFEEQKNEQSFVGLEPNFIYYMIKFNDEIEGVLELEDFAHDHNVSVEKLQRLVDQYNLHK